MAVRDNFSAEEWATVARSPMMAGMVVMLAGKSGPIQIVQETFAVGGALSEAAGATSNSLIQALVESARAGERPAQPAEQPRSVEAARSMAMADLRSVATLVDAKLSAGEATEYKRWLVAISEKVAQAAKEGGFLGFGGTQVTDEERAATAEVAAVLGVTG